MFIPAMPLKRGKDTVLINTDQIVSAEQRLLFLDYAYKVTMSNGQQFVVEDEAKMRLRALMLGNEHEVTDLRTGAVSPHSSSEM